MIAPDRIDEFHTDYSSEVKQLIQSLTAVHTENSNNVNPHVATNSSIQQQKNPKLYKTELCRTFADTGHCNYGDRCQYAHGESEIRPVPRHPKYKTAFCQSYHKMGYCPYGSRCHFIHSEKPWTTGRRNRHNMMNNKFDSAPRLQSDVAANSEYGRVNATNSIYVGNFLSSPISIISSHDTPESMSPVNENDEAACIYQWPCDSRPKYWAFGHCLPDVAKNITNLSDYARTAQTSFSEPVREQARSSDELMLERMIRKMNFCEHYAYAPFAYDDRLPVFNDIDGETASF